jgi:phage terminase Nu1 subunit (DNA packaging protein)
MKMKSAKPNQKQPPVSALQTVGALGRELARLAKQLEDTAKEISRTDEVSRRAALEKLNAQRSATFARLAKQALAAEKELGLLVEKSDIVAVWSRAIAEFRSTMERIPRRVADRPIFKGLDPVDVELTIRREVDVAIHELYKSAGGTEPLPPAQT